MKSVCRIPKVAMFCFAVLSAPVARSEAVNEPRVPNLAERMNCSAKLQRIPVLLDMLKASPDVRVLPYLSPDLKHEWIPGMLATDPQFQRVEEIVTDASMLMQRRGWSPTFLKERLDVAKKFSSNSTYLQIKLKNLLRPEDRAAGKSESSWGTIGITDAGYNALLPMEETHGWRLPRDYTIELRTYSMHPDSPNEVFTAIMGNLGMRLAQIARLRPDFWNKKVLYTYGDQVSVRMYQRMGFEIETDPTLAPVLHDGTLWTVLKISPAELLVNFRRMQTLYLLSPRPGSFSIKMPDGKFYESASDRPVGFFGNQIISLRLKTSYEIFPGHWVLPESEINWFSGGHEISDIGGFTEDVEVSQGLWAARKSLVSWYKSGLLMHVRELARPYVALSGIVYPAKSEINFAPTGEVINFLPK